MEREELLESIEEIQKSYENLDVKFLITVILSMIIVFLLVFPKIYLRNHIYYTSRDINKLLSEYETLKEENRLLKQKLEKIKFENRVSDRVF